jgi:hypothetical protein
MPVALQRWPAWRRSDEDRCELSDDLQINADVNVIADQPATGFERDIPTNMVVDSCAAGCQPVAEKIVSVWTTPAAQLHVNNPLRRSRAAVSRPEPSAAKDQSKSGTPLIELRPLDILQSPAGSSGAVGA